MYESIVSSHVEDLAGLLGRSVVFTVSERFPGWLTANDAECGEIYLRWGSAFPAEDQWSLWLGDGWFDFNEVPVNWDIQMGKSLYPWRGVPLDPSLPVNDKEEITDLLLSGDA